MVKKTGFLITVLLFFFMASTAIGQQGGKFPQPAVCSGIPKGKLTTQMLTVRGHRLAVAEAGDPTGFPVFYAHGNPGSRLELALLDQDARRFGYRLIVFDRPGFGKSPLIKPYSLKDFAEDLATLADLKKIAHFGLIGWSSGVPPVIATSYYYPQRVEFTFAISGYTDFSRFPDAQQFMADKGLPGAKLAQNHPLAFSVTVWGVRHVDLYRPDFYLREAVEKMPPFDRRMLDSPASACLFMRTQQEGVRQGSDGAVQDLNVQWRYWGFEMSAVKNPVQIMQGEADVFVPQEFGRHLSANLANGRLHLFPGKGHLLPFSSDFREEMFSQARQLQKISLLKEENSKR
ncbi:MAG: alpha/beta hydrolase [Smithella sp.]|jgi:pimeloyl-ACP methyl ester carboxylesterase